MKSNKKIKILHIAQAAGGVDRYIQMLLRYLDKNKFENILICSYDYEKGDYMKLVDSFEQIVMERSIGFSDLKAAFVVRKIIKKYKPDIIYAHSSKAGAIARMANIGIKNKCFYNPHGWAFNMRSSRWKLGIYVILERIMAKFCDKIICISDAEKKSALEKKICSIEKLQVIFNGIDIEAYDERNHNVLKREELGVPKEAFIIGMVGRLSPQKAPDTFIAVAEKIKRYIPSAYFIMVGDGEQKEEVEHYAEKHGFADSLLITGWVDNVVDYIELFDVAVLFSRWEGFGLVLPEYMMASKPIVATRVDAIPNIITDYKNGILVKVDDITEAYNAIIELYENSELRVNLIKQALEDVQYKFDVKRVAKEHELLFLK